MYIVDTLFKLKPSVKCFIETVLGNMCLRQICITALHTPSEAAASHFKHFANKFVKMTSQAKRISRVLSDYVQCSDAVGDCAIANEKLAVRSPAMVGNIFYQTNPTSLTKALS